MTGNLEELNEFAAYPAALGECIVQAWQGTSNSGMDNPSVTSVTSVGMLAWLQPADEDDQADNHVPDKDKMCEQPNWLNPLDDAGDSQVDAGGEWHSVSTPERPRLKRARWLSGWS